MFRHWFYRFTYWAFYWVTDSDGDVGLQFLHMVTFIKYKEHTLVYWFRKFQPANKWQGHYQEEL